MSKLTMLDMRSKPKMRWWLTGAFLDEVELEKEIKELVSAGYGGAEILYFMGIPTKEVAPENYKEYYFGSKKWNHYMKHALQIAISHDFQLDFTIGPLWPIATPAIQAIEDDRSSWGLHIAALDFCEHYEGSMPVPKTLIEERRFQRVGAVIAKKMYEAEAVYLVSSTKDVSTQVDPDTDQITLMLDDHNSDNQNETWTLFVFYAQTTGQMNDSSISPVIDHLSRDATEAVIDYWENHVFEDEEIKTLYEKNGGDLFCDSLEVCATMIGGMYNADPLPVILWTPKMLSEFRQRRGYELLPLLPCLFIEGLYQHLANRNLDRGAKYIFDQYELNHQIQNDYYQTLTELVNENHIQLLQRWANRHHMKLRYQVYGLPTELTSGLHAVDVPESESLGFCDCTESVLLLAGAVHVERKPIYSYELGAVLGRAYEQMWTERRGLLWQMHQAMAGGVNQVVLHGMSYDTKSVIGPVEPIFKWPGLSLMGTTYSNEWGNRQPIWEHAFFMTAYISRLQWILRQGKPRVDVAIYHHEYEGLNYEMNPKSNPLRKLGYSYEFMSPYLLSICENRLERVDGRLVCDPEGAAYKAILVDDQENRETKGTKPPLLSIDELELFRKMAEKGYCIFWGIGEPQASYRFGKEGELGRMQEMYRKLIEYPCVHLFEGHNQLLTLLKEQAILPDRVVESESELTHVRRSVDSLDYYYLYNTREDISVEETMELIGHGKPYLINCWNGKAQEIKDFCKTDTGIRLMLRFVPNEAKVIGIGEMMTEVEESIQVEHSEEKIIELKEWNLTIKQYLPGSHPTQTLYEKKDVGLTQLLPWKEIKGLECTSGIGTYTTLLDLEEPVKSCILSLGKVADTVLVRVNDQLFIPNQMTREVDITSGLKKRKNRIEVEVATTLNNALVGIGEKKTLQEYGILERCFIRYR